MSYCKPKSPTRLLVEQLVRDAGASGMTRAALTLATGASSTRIGRTLNNMIAPTSQNAGEFSMVRRSGGHAIYVLSKHAASVPTQAPPTTSKVQRPLCGSPDRANVIAALKAASAPLTLAQLSIAAGVGLGETRDIVLSLQRAGTAQNTGTGAKPLWALRQNMPTAAPARLCNSSQPPAMPKHLPAMHCARSGADQHLSVPSRRGDERASYRAPMMIGSMLGGGL